LYVIVHLFKRVLSIGQHACTHKRTHARAQSHTHAYVEVVSVGSERKIVRAVSPRKSIYKR